MTALCALCARRDRHREADAGVVCSPCKVRIDDTLAAIVRLAGEAGAWVEIGTAGSSTVHSVPSSRPPLNVEALDPERADAPVFRGQEEPPTVTNLLGMWDRMIREERGFTSETSANLTGIVWFLRTQLDWICETPTFPVEDFADEVAAAARPMWRWDLAADEREPASVVHCPTLIDDQATCGKRLLVRRWTRKDQTDPDPIRCRRCGVERTPTQLIHAVGIDDAYVPASIAAEHFGIPASTIREWASQGHVKRHEGRYRYGDIRERVATRRRRVAG